MPNLTYSLPIDETATAQLGVVTRKGKLLIEAIDQPTVTVTGAIDAALSPDNGKLVFLAAHDATEGATGVITVANPTLEALVITVTIGAAAPDVSVGITADLAHAVLAPVPAPAA